MKRSGMPSQAKRGRKSDDEPDYIKDILVRNSEKLIKEGKLRGPGDKIWISIRDQYNISKTPKALYTCVSCNRWNIKQELGLIGKQTEGAFTDDVEEEENDEQADEEQMEFEKQYDDDENATDSKQMCEVNTKSIPQNTSFKIHIPKDKWNAMEPEEKMYIRKIQRSNQTLHTKRLYMVLKPGIWSDIFNSTIWETIKWPCTWSFKRNVVSVTDEAKFWIFIKAKCTCGNSLEISCPNPPPADPKDNGVSLDVNVWGDKSNHIQLKNCVVRKRAFAGEKRRQLGEVMIEKNIKASRIRRLLSSEMMEFRDPYPAHLPSNEVVRQIRSEAIKTRRLDNDPVVAVQQLKYSKNPLYMFCIREIGLDPFFVHLVTPDQLKLYNLYCKNNYSRLIIDATGKIVHKLKKPGDLLSSHIFLYLGVVRIPGKGEGLVPVVQMLSERHNANAIHYWLSEWIRAGATVPNEVVLDDSAALISATCRSLGKESTTAAYIEKCFKHMNDEDVQAPSTLIRIDVAHFTNFIRKWPELGYPMKKKTREFYIRVIIILAKSETMEELKDLLKSIFVVAFSETEGTSATSGKSTPCQTVKRQLNNLIAGNTDVVIEDLEYDYGKKTEEDHAHVSDLENLTEEDASSVGSLSSWIEKIREEAIETVLDDGDHDNIMHSPPLANKLVKLLQILPLWCNILPRKMESPYSSSIGAYVETEIGQLKNNLLKNNRPTRIDEFVMDYLQVCDGSIKVAATIESISKKYPSLQSKVHSKVQSKVVEKSSNYFETDSITVEECNVSEIQDPRTLPLQNPPSCPACANGNFPGEAHMCAICDKFVHAVELCSVVIPGEEDGQSRMCISCIKTNTPNHNISMHHQKPITAKPITENKHQLSLKTSIIDRQDLTTKLNSNELECTSVEGWRGLSLPPKKRSQGYYWRTNPDFPKLMASSCQTQKIGVLKNGMDPSLKIVKVDKLAITLSNTCSFDAVCQLFATSYIDSTKYSAIIDSHDVSHTILDVAKNIATKGVNTTAYKKRASVLARNIKRDNFKGGVTKIECSMDCSSLLRQLNIMPSVKENYTCSSKFCPKPATIRQVNVVSAIFIENSDTCMKKLAEILDQGDVTEASPCLTPMPPNCINVSPDEAYITDPTLSDKSSLCSGTKTRQVQVGPHLLIELVGKERMHNSDGQIGVSDPVKSALVSIPRQLTYKNVEFHLRGIVGFTPPLRDSDIGHYRGFALRGDGSWQIYDDLKEKVLNVDGCAKVNAHLLVFTQ